MTYAACFFKSPVGGCDDDLCRQYAALDRHLEHARLDARRRGVASVG